MADGAEDQTLTDAPQSGEAGTDETAAGSDRTGDSGPASANGSDVDRTHAGGEPDRAPLDRADTAADEADDDEAGDDEADDDGDNPLETEGEIAADYLEELLDIADLDGDIDTYVENGRAQVSVLTESESLVGKNGEVLEALQELSRLAVLTETGSRSRLMLDVSGHRERRRTALTAMATDAVQEVKDSGDSVRLEPMNPFERKIVHDAVAAAGLTSESEGEEPQRRVVILP